MIIFRIPPYTVHIKRNRGGIVRVDILKTIRFYAETAGTRIAFSSRAGSISYAELWRRSGNLAGWINLEMGENREPVIVFGHKDPMMIVCFLACVRSGRAYCPLDIPMSEKRIQEIMRQIREPLFLTADPERFPAINGAVSYEKIWEISDRDIIYLDICSCRKEDFFYVIFTSGSSGQPKSVPITADNLNHYLAWAVTLAGGIRTGAVFLNQAPYSYDLSVMDLYLSLATGGTVSAVDHNLLRDTGELIRYIRTQGIDYWSSTPSFAELCLDEPAFAETNQMNVSAFLFYGEPLSPETMGRLMERFPEAKIVNTYGLAETTVCDAGRD